MVTVGAALPPRILNITVPQVGHFPLMALRPFFIVSSTPSAISRLALHLTQYPSAIKTFTARASCPNGDSRIAKPDAKRNSEREPVKPVENQLIKTRAKTDCSKRCLSFCGVKIELNIAGVGTVTPANARKFYSAFSLRIFCSFTQLVGHRQTSLLQKFD